MTKTQEDYSEELESQYKRLERTHDEIITELESKTFSKSPEQLLDPAYSFFLNCYHLREWVRKDIKVDSKIKDALPTFEKDNSPVQFLICRDLANKSKHASLEERDKHKPNDPNTKIEISGGGVFKVSFKELELANQKKETIHLKAEDSIFMGSFTVIFRDNLYDLKGIIQGCMHVWKKFFENNDLLLPRSTPYSK